MHEYKEPIPEPFEKRRINEVRAAESRSVYGQSVTSAAKAPAVNEQLTDNTSKLQTAKASASALVAGTAIQWN